MDTPGGGVTRAAATVGAGLVGVIYLSGSASLKVVVPGPVGERAPPDATPYTEILFTPDVPTMGFPVLQRGME